MNKKRNIILILIFISIFFIKDFVLSQNYLLPEPDRHRATTSSDDKQSKNAGTLQNRYFNAHLKLLYYRMQQRNISQVISEHKDIDALKNYRAKLEKYTNKLDEFVKELEKKIDNKSISSIKSYTSSIMNHLNTKNINSIERIKTVITDGLKNYNDLKNQLKSEITSECKKCKVQDDGENILIRVYNDSWFNSGSSELKKSAHKILEKLATKFIEKNYNYALGIVIKAHTDSDGPNYIKKWYRFIGDWNIVSEDIRKNTALDLLDENGDLLEFKYYYQYRLIPSVPSGKSAVVLYDQSYKATFDYNYQLSRERAEAVDSYMREAVPAYDDSQFEVKYIGAAFLEPIVQNHPVNYLSAEEKTLYKDEKALNRRVEFSIYIAYDRIIKLVQNEEWGYIKEYMRNN